MAFTSPERQWRHEGGHVSVGEAPTSSNVTVKFEPDGAKFLIYCCPYMISNNRQVHTAVISLERFGVWCRFTTIL